MSNSLLNHWVDECARLTNPLRIHWCDGSEGELDRLTASMVDDGTFVPLNGRTYPGCYLHRSNPNDVARVEKVTFICSEREEDAGPTNHWMAPTEAKERVGGLFRGCMAGRTMYVIPYVMGPLGSPFSKIGVEITDSPYVVASMRIMTRMGQAALDQLGSSEDFVPGLHSVGELDPERRFILHFPEERLIWSYGSGYGGNALLGKKCFALRIASVQARDEGWMAEHMLILELEGPDREKTYFAAAFPSACGKTNLAMLVSPLEDIGYRVRTVGDDIAWLRIGEDGRLWAVNPESGFFGVAPGTNMETNPNAILTARSNSIFTNVAMTSGGEPWWEGMSETPPARLIDWQGRPWSGTEPAAHPNSRFTAPARQCPSISPSWEDPRGVPISGIIFGGRRSSVVPLVFQSFDWQHGTYVGAAMASETTAAAAGKTGVLRRDPMAMLPFCGYHIGDYFRHWLEMGRRIPNPPAIFHVNWFRKGRDGRYLWPGYGDNVRILIWMLERLKGDVSYRETPIGFVPVEEEVFIDSLQLPRDELAEVFAVDRDEWRTEVEDVEAYLTGLGDRVPEELMDELRAFERRLD